MNINKKRLTVLLFASFAALVAFSCTKETELDSSPANRLSGVDGGLGYYDAGWTFEYDDQGVLVSFFMSNEYYQITYPCVWEDGLLVKIVYGNSYYDDSYYCSYDEQGRLVSMVQRDTIPEFFLVKESYAKFSYNDKGEIESIVREGKKVRNGYEEGNVSEYNFEWENGNVSNFHYKDYRWYDNPSNIDKDSLYFEETIEDLEYDSHPNPFLQLPLAVRVLLHLDANEGDFTFLCKNNCVTETKYTYKNNGYPLYCKGWINRKYEYSGMID